jgi:hypothetical protein
MRDRFVFLFVFLLALCLAQLTGQSGHAWRSLGLEAAPAGGVAFVAYECTSPARLQVQFQWNPSGEGSQWADLSLFDNDFSADTFIALGPLPAGQGTLIWRGLLAGNTHFLRINTLTPSGWEPSPTLVFTTPSCGDVTGARNLGLDSQDCVDRGQVRIHSAWEPNGQGTQWVDLSLHNNGFVPGTFVGAGPLHSSQGSLLWTGLLPGETHYLRVNTQTSIGWLPSETLVFLTLPDCQ